MDLSHLVESELPRASAPPNLLSRGSLNHQSRRFWHIIGVKGLLVISLGSLLPLGSTLFLCFLWLEAAEASKQEGAKPSRLWQNIVLAGWITRAVTITAAIIRSVITAQAAVVATMIASIIIESTGIHLSHLPILSIARAVALSPLDLAIPAFTNLRLSPGTVYLPIVIITTTSCFLTLGSQFIATILLSDFGIANIARPADVANRTVQPIEEFTLGKPWNAAPQAFWRFAEYRKSTEDRETPPHIADTGRALRAALWTDAKSRANLRFYSGEAHLWDARVVYHSPILANATCTTEIRSPVDDGATSAHGDPNAMILLQVDQPYVDAEDDFTTIMPVPTLTHSGIYTPTTTISGAISKTSLPTSIKLQGSVVYDEPEHPLSEGERLGPDSLNCTVPWSMAFSVCRVGGSSHLRSLIYQTRQKADVETSKNVNGYIVFSLESTEISHTDLEKM